MPTVLKVSGHRFFFFSLEGQEPPHVHVEQAERYAKIWQAPVGLAHSKGFRSGEINEIMVIARRNTQYFQEKWDEHFAR